MENQKLTVVNLFAGPGAGKSTARAGLFYLMKSQQWNVEEVTEYAKDVTWDETQVLLSDQLWMLAKQNRRLTRLRGKVEFAVSDSPLLLTINYVPPDYLPINFKALTRELWETYNNVNFFIERTKPYNPIGRNQTEQEAKEIDTNIRKILDENQIPYLPIKGDVDAPEVIFEELKYLTQRNE